MKKMMLVGCVSAFLFTTAGINAAAPQEAMKEVTKNETKVTDILGVDDIKEKDGKVISFKSYGSATIHSEFGMATAKRIAQKKATLAAKAAIVEWIKSSITSGEYSIDDGIAITKTAPDKKEKTTKVAESYVNKVESFAQGIVKGAKVIACEIKKHDDGTQEMIVTVGWSAKNAKRADQTNKIMNSEGKQKNNTQKTTSKVKTGRVVSSDFDEF